MDDANLRDLERLRDKEVKKRGGVEKGVGKVMLFGEFGKEDAKGKRMRKRAEEVEDPYYGGDEGFEKAYEQCVRFGKGFLGALERGEVS